jgi:hypothetical protein
VQRYGILGSVDSFQCIEVLAKRRTAEEEFRSYALFHILRELVRLKISFEVNISR